MADVICWAGCFKTSSRFPLDDPAGLDGPVFRSTHPMMQSLA